MAENKDFWYIIDYYGVLWELDSAIEQYSSLEGFEKEDLENTFTNITSEIQKLPQKYSELWDLFKSISNKRDLEAFEQLLRDEEKRDEFYSKLREYGKTLKIAISSVRFHDETDPKLVDTYKNELLMFYKLRQSVASRYSDEVDYRKYESQIQNLIDKHITSDEVKTVVESINIFEKEKFQNEINKVIGEAARADTIASRTAKYIQEKMEEDSTFYKKFSEILKETIKEYELHRISESEYLNRVQSIMDSVLAHKDDTFPEEVCKNDVTKALYGIIREFMVTKNLSIENTLKASIFVSLQADEIFKNSKIVDWRNNPDIIKKMKIQIFDMMYDELKIKYSLDIFVN